MVKFNEIFKALKGDKENTKDTNFFENFKNYINRKLHKKSAVEENSLESSQSNEELENNK